MRLSKYNSKKRIELKKQLKEMANMIIKLKDDRKTIKPKRFPDFVRPEGVWLDTTQSQYRYLHIAASLMRGKTLQQIETLPKGFVWTRNGTLSQNVDFKPKKNYIKPDMVFINNIIFEYVLDENKANYRLDSNLGKVVFDENVCIGSKDFDQESASGSSWPRIG